MSGRERDAGSYRSDSGVGAGQTAHHERRANHILGEVEGCRNGFKRSNKVVVAHNGKAPEHVEDAPHEQNHSKVRVLGHEEGVAHAGGIVVEAATVLVGLLIVATREVAEYRNHSQQTQDKRADLRP